MIFFITYCTQKPCGHITWLERALLLFPICSNYRPVNSNHSFDCPDWNVDFPQFLLEVLSFFFRKKNKKRGGKRVSDSPFALLIKTCATIFKEQLWIAFAFTQCLCFQRWLAVSGFVIWYYTEHHTDLLAVIFMIITALPRFLSVTHFFLINEQFWWPKRIITIWFWISPFF